MPAAARMSGNGASRARGPARGAALVALVAPRDAVAAALAGATFLLLNLQSITVTGQFLREAEGQTPKLYHAALGALALLVLGRGRLVRWRPEALLYFAVTLGTSLLAYLAGVPHPFVLNVLIAAYACAVAATLGLLSGAVRLLPVLRATSAVLLVAVVVKGVVFRDAFITFFAAPDGHPVLPLFFGGGTNIEASWLALGGCFWLGSAWLLPYALVCLAISTLYASRIGMLLAVAVLAVGVLRALWEGTISRRRRRALLVGAGVLAVAGGAAVVTLAESGGLYVLERFTSVGEDKGSMGRLLLWEGAVRVFTQQPLGVGFGNAVPAVARVTGEPILEDNLHNLYLQHLVETGVHGLVAFLLVVGLTWWRAAASRFRDPLLVFCSLYFVAALLQFRGADVPLWFVFGLQMGVAARREVAHA